MLVKARWQQEIRVLKLSGRFDKAASVPIDRALTIPEGWSCKQVVLDFSNVSSMDSAGIGKLLLLYHSLRRMGVALSVRNPRPSVEKLLHLVNFSTIIPIVWDHEPVRSVA